jgi:hypothetical protein
MRKMLRILILAVLVLPLSVPTLAVDPTPLAPSEDFTANDGWRGRDARGDR